MANIWAELKAKKQPFLVLAPMEDVTDTVFRQIVGRCGAPDLYFTEFTSAEGLLSKGSNEVGLRLRYTEIEKPLIAQIWGTTPEAYFKSAKMIVGMGFDGIDLNFGCPVEKIIKQGACSALIKNPSLAGEIIKATKEGAGELPVSVKTRIGFNEIATEEWCGFLLEQGVAALTVHGRLAKELSKFPANWDEVAKVVTLRDKIAPETVLLGNGDILSYPQAISYAQTYGVDGIMIGRGIFQNPWIFNPGVDESQKTPRDRLNLLSEHLNLFNEVWGDEKDFNIMKKFVKMYVKGFDGAAELRDEMMKCKTVEELSTVAKGAEI